MNALVHCDAMCRAIDAPSKREIAMNEQVAMFELGISDVDEQIEAIAKDIEFTQATAVIRVAERLSAARDLFRYRRNGEGFIQWAETRLRISESTAYNLLAVHERFGAESLQNLETLPRSVLYILAMSSAARMRV